MAEQTMQIPVGVQKGANVILQLQADEVVFRLDYENIRFSDEHQLVYNTKTGEFRVTGLEGTIGAAEVKSVCERVLQSRVKNGLDRDPNKSRAVKGTPRLQMNALELEIAQRDLYW